MMRRLVRGLLRRIVSMWYAARDSKTPLWARTTLLGAIGYFIWPLDAIPDFLAPVGYSEDLGILFLALLTVGYYTNDDHRQRAEAVLDRWFGPRLKDDARIIDVTSTPAESK